MFPTLKKAAFYLPVEKILELNEENRQKLYGDKAVQPVYQYCKPAAGAAQRWPADKIAFEAQIGALCKHLENLVTNKNLKLKPQEAEENKVLAEKIHKNEKQYVEAIHKFNKQILFLSLTSEESKRNTYQKHAENPSLFAEIKFSLEKIILHLLGVAEKIIDNNAYVLNDKISLLSLLDDICMKALSVCAEGVHDKLTEIKRNFENKADIKSLMAQKIHGTFTQIGAKHVAEREKELTQIISALQGLEKKNIEEDLKKLRGMEVHAPKFYQSLAHKQDRFPDDMPFKEDIYTPKLILEGNEWKIYRAPGQDYSNALMITDKEVNEFNPMFDSMFNGYTAIEYIANHIAHTLLPLFHQVKHESEKGDKEYKSAINETNEKFDQLMQEMGYVEKDRTHVLGFFDEYAEENDRYKHKSDQEVFYWSYVYACRGLQSNDLIEGIISQKIMVGKKETEYLFMTAGSTQWIEDQKGNLVALKDFIETDEGEFRYDAAEMVAFLNEKVTSYGLTKALATEYQNKNKQYGLDVHLDKRAQDLKVIYNIDCLRTCPSFLVIDTLQDLSDLVFKSIEAGLLYELIYALQNMPRRELQKKFSDALLNPKEFLIAKDILTKLDLDPSELHKNNLPGPEIYISQEFLNNYLASDFPKTEDWIIPTCWVGKPPEKIPPHFYSMRDYQSIKNLNKYPLEDLFEFYPPLITYYLEVMNGPDPALKLVAFQEVLSALKKVAAKPDRKNICNQMRAYALVIESFSDIQNLFEDLCRTKTLPSNADLSLLSSALINYPDREKLKKIFLTALLSHDMLLALSARSILEAIDSSDHLYFMDENFIHLLVQQNDIANRIDRIPSVWKRRIFYKKIELNIEPANFYALLTKYEDFIKFCGQEIGLWDVFCWDLNLMTVFMREVSSDLFPSAFANLLDFCRKNHHRRKDIFNFFVTALSSLNSFSQLYYVLNHINAKTRHEVINKIRPQVFSLNNFLEYNRKNDILLTKCPMLLQQILFATPSLSVDQLECLLTEPSYRDLDIRKALAYNDKLISSMVRLSAVDALRILKKMDSLNEDLLSKTLINLLDAKVVDELLETDLPAGFLFYVPINLIHKSERLKTKILSYFEDWLQSPDSNHDNVAWTRVQAMLAPTELHPSLKWENKGFFLLGAFLRRIQCQDKRIFLTRTGVTFYDPDSDVYIEWTESESSGQKFANSNSIKFQTYTQFEEKYMNSDYALSNLLRLNRPELYQRFICLSMTKANYFNFLIPTLKRMIEWASQDDGYHEHRDFHVHSILKLFNHDTIYYRIFKKLLTLFHAKIRNPDEFSVNLIFMARNDIEQFFLVMDDLSSFFYSKGLCTELFDVLLEHYHSNSVGEPMQQKILQFIQLHVKSIHQYVKNPMPFYRFIFENNKCDIVSTLQAMGYHHNIFRDISASKVRFLQEFILSSEDPHALSIILHHTSVSYWPALLQSLKLLPNDGEYSFEWLISEQDSYWKVNRIFYSYAMARSFTQNIKEVLHIENRPEFMNTLYRYGSIHEIKEAIIAEYTQAYMTHNADMTNVIAHAVRQFK